MDYGLLWTMVYFGLWFIVDYGLLWTIVYCGLWFIVDYGLLWTMVYCGLLFIVDYCLLWGNQSNKYGPPGTVTSVTLISLGKPTFDKPRGLLLDQEYYFFVYKMSYL